MGAAAERDRRPGAAGIHREHGVTRVAGAGAALLIGRFLRDRGRRHRRRADSEDAPEEDRAGLDAFIATLPKDIPAQPQKKPAEKVRQGS